MRGRDGDFLQRLALSGGRGRSGRTGGRRKGGGYDQKWAAVSGWLMILAGLLVLFAGLADFLASRNIIAQAFFPTSKPVWMISAIVLGSLFTAVGIAILKKIRRSS